MQSLIDFKISHVGEVALCEIDGLTQYANPELANVNTFTTATEIHPKIHLTRESLNHNALSEESETLFLPTDSPFLKRLSQVFTEHGSLSALHFAAANNNQLVISKLAFLALAVYNYVRQIVNPNVLLNEVQLISSYSQTRNWLNNSIRCVCWHPHSSRLAIATIDDSVRIYSNNNSFIPLLRCKEQRTITGLAWRPKSFTEIAVSHANGIIIWNIDFNALVARPSISNAVILSRINHSPVMSIVWNPWGDILVSCAASDSKIYVWDVELNKTSQLKGWDSGNTLLKWSPDNKKLLSVSDGIVFRIWDCEKWTSDRWTVLEGRVQTACWSNCGSILLFSTTTEPVIYGLTVHNDRVFPSNLSASKDHATQLFDVSRVDMDGVSFGGIVQTMEIDPSGRHLAIFFIETNYICIFNIVKNPQLKLIPSSLVNGLASEMPGCICFQQDFKSGACLTIAWSSGRIQHFPIVYTDFNDLNSSQRHF